MVELPAEPLALYVHWPWCVRKCPYCDFNSHAAPAAIPERDYIAALLADLDDSLTLCESRRPLTSIFFGGGTPSLMTPEGFHLLMQGIRERVATADDCEITIEANPGTIDTANLPAYVHAGVNRISIGVQSFTDASLRKLGRIHSAQQAVDAVKLAVRVCGNVNLDLMFALPGQTVETLQSDLDTAFSLGVQHMSCYELTIEEGTAFAKALPDGLPDEDLVYDMNDIVHEKVRAAGFVHYEVSGYAAPGHFCRHNLTYWTFGDYLGIGAGAHGKISTRSGVLRTQRSARPAAYISEALNNRLAAQTRHVPPEQLPFEFMLNAPRLIEGVSADLWQRRTGLDMGALEPALSELKAQGLLVDDPSRIEPTDKGRLFLSDIQAAFLP